MARQVKAKKRCCEDDPRCKRCPVVCRRLEQAGYLERVRRRRWVVLAPPPKKVLKALRARRPKSRMPVVDQSGGAQPEIAIDPLMASMPIATTKAAGTAVGSRRPFASSNST